MNLRKSCNPKSSILAIFIIAFFAIGCFNDTIHTTESEEIEDDLSGQLDIKKGNFDDFIIKSELDTSVLSSSGEFEIASHSILMAVEKQSNKPVFFGLPSIGDQNYQLSAKETALYFACLAIPHIRRPYYRRYIHSIKSALYELDEVKSLENAIEQSIEDYGHLNYSVVGPEIGIAVDKIISEFRLVEKAYSKGREVLWDPSYAAGKGFYRVSDETPNNWIDKYDQNTGVYTLKREFFNQTAAVVGVKVEKYDLNNNGVVLPLQHNYIGFIEPHYPPDLLSLEGTWENLKSWAESTSDIWSNGVWDGLENTDAYSSNNIFKFDAIEGQKDAFVFVNGHYDIIVDAVNILYLFMDNFQDVFEDKYPGYFTNEDFINGFFTYLIQNNASTLPNYITWFQNRDYDQIIQDASEKLRAFTLSGVFDPSQNYITSILVDAIDDRFVELAGTMGVVHEYSRKSLKVANYLVISKSPKFAAAIPIEFDELLFPPYPYKPVPFIGPLNNVSSFNFQWSIENPNNQNLSYSIYLGKKENDLQLIASSINQPNYTIRGLSKNTRYYWQVEVKNANGKTSEGATWTFDNGNVAIDKVIDVDGNEYTEVAIGDQVWLKENMRTTKFPDGSPITNFAPNGDPGNSDEYGLLYVGDEIMGESMLEKAQGICPDGFHIPSDLEFQTLINTTNQSFSDITDDSGFAGKLAGGFNYGTTNTYFNFNHSGYYFSSTFDEDKVNLSTLWLWGGNPREVYTRKSGSHHGCSVRCIKD